MQLQLSITFCTLQQARYQLQKLANDMQQKFVAWSYQDIGRIAAYEKQNQQAGSNPQ